MNRDIIYALFIKKVFDFNQRGERGVSSYNVLPLPTIDDALLHALILYMKWRSKEGFAQLSPTYKGEGARMLELRFLICLC
jgi:hypothetical protein